MGQELRSGPSWAVLAQGLMWLQPRFSARLQTSEGLLKAGGLISRASYSNVWQAGAGFAGVGVGDGAGPLFLTMEASS